MKKFISIFLASFVMLFLFSGNIFATSCDTLKNTAGEYVHPELSTPAPTAQDPNYRKPIGIVSCGQYSDCACEFNDFFVMIKKIYVFIIWYIATPLAGLLIVLGGLFLTLSGANQKLHDLGKQMLWGAVWGVALIFGAYLIVGLVMMALGYQGAWSGF